MKQEYKYPKSVQTLVGILKRNKIAISKSSRKKWDDHATSGVCVYNFSGWIGSHFKSYCVTNMYDKAGFEKAIAAIKAEGFHIIQESEVCAYVAKMPV
jgi:hypothetical protein